MKGLPFAVRLGWCVSLFLGVAIQTALAANGLAKLARDEKSNVRSAALSRITDTALLQKLADSDPEAYIQKAAARRLEALNGKKK